MSFRAKVMAARSVEVVPAPAKASEPMPTFHDGKYNNVQAKESIYRALVRFVNSDFDPRKFTKALYKHLSLHFGFIAHYDLGGFYHARFADPDGRMSTYDAISKASQWMFNDENTSGNGDLNKAIQEFVVKNKDKFVGGAKSLKTKMLLEQKAKIEEELKKLGHSEVKAALDVKTLKKSDAIGNWLKDLLSISLDMRSSKYFEEEPGLKDAYDKLQEVIKVIRPIVVQMNMTKY